jgi:hypothetical protein
VGFARTEVGATSGSVRGPGSRVSYSISGSEHINLCNQLVEILQG